MAAWRPEVGNEKRRLEELKVGRNITIFLVIMHLSDHPANYDTSDSECPMGNWRPRSWQGRSTRRLALRQVQVGDGELGACKRRQLKQRALVNGDRRVRFD